MHQALGSFRPGETDRQGKIGKSFFSSRLLMMGLFRWDEGGRALCSNIPMEMGCPQPHIANALGHSHLIE